jgi:arylformamidase
MAAVDYETEYNNRARVPEHPEIFARWTREAEDYRAEALKAGRAELGLFYGDTPRQTVDLFFPASTVMAPVAIFVHGGWWRSLDASQFSQMARGLNANGVIVGVAGYDLCPNVGIGDIVAQIRRACVFMWQRYNRPLLLVGHSAGGHLAGAMVATDWPSLYPKAPADLVPAGYAISGVFDLAPLVGISINQDLKLDAASARELSPLYWPVQPGRIFDAVCGGLESDEFKRQSRVLAETWERSGAKTRFEAIPGTNHFTVIDALADPQSAMTARVTELVRAIRT